MGRVWDATLSTPGTGTTSLYNPLSRLLCSLELLHLGHTDPADSPDERPAVGLADVPLGVRPRGQQDHGEDHGEEKLGLWSAGNTDQRHGQLLLPPAEAEERVDAQGWIWESLRL